MKLPPVERAAPIAEGAAVIVAIGIAFAGQLSLWDWFVEDSAISFAYARNLAEGWGLVRFPGDERVEAYSNPLWVLMLSAWHVVGVDAFRSSKGMALALAAVTVPAVWAIARRAGFGAAAAVLAALLLATDAQFVIWSASGLENALFCALLALAMWRTHADDADGTFPWAAVAFLGLAVTRPEGIAYAAIGGAWALLLEIVGQRRWSRIFAWLGVFWGPFALYHALRYDYFAFPFPSTYYAKVGDVEPRPFAWNARSWTYLRAWCEELGRAWFLPVLLAGVIGLKGWRAWAVASMSVWLGAVLLYPGVEPFIGWGWIPKTLNAPSWWVTFRVASLGIVVVLAPILGLGADGWRARGLAWWLGVFALGFAVWSTGDWMRGYRWFSLSAVPMAVLLGIGCVEIARLVGRVGRNGWGARAGGALLAGAIAAASIAPEVAYQAVYVPETTPASVDRRVQHYRWAKQLLQLEHVDVLDHDMGAMLYWGGDLGIVRDSRGLVDIAFALHERQVAFVREYAWQEYPFDFAHAHASTGAAVRLQGAAWRDRYVEMPGYGVNNFHTANFVKKSHLVRDRWDGPTEQSARFAEGVVLHGLHLRAPEVSPGSWLAVDFGLSTEPRPNEPIRVLLLLVSEAGVATALDLPLGLEDWYPVTDWQRGEIFQGRVSVPIPPDLALGDYTLGAVVLGPHRVLPVEEVGPAGSIPETPVFAAGEARFSGVAHIVDRDTMAQAARADVGRVSAEANRDRCEQARDAWRDAMAHRIRSMDWQASVRPGVADTLATCFARRARTSDHRQRAVSDIREARRWNRVHPDVLQAGAALGDVWFAEGRALRRQGDIEGAYTAFRDTLYADPSRSWARRYVEELRSERLSLGWN